MTSGQQATKAKWSVHKSAAEQAEKQSDADAAELNWLAALEAAEALNEAGFTLLMTLENLARVYFGQKKYAQAAPIMRRVLKAYQVALGPNHQDVAIVANNLAILYHCWDKFADAAEHYNIALDVRSKLLPSTDPTIVQLKANLSSVLNEMSHRGVGDWILSDTCKKEAQKPTDEQIAPVLRPELRPDANDTKRTLGWKMILESAVICKNKNDFKGAEKMYIRALELAEMRQGDDHIVVAYISLEFAEFYFTQKHFDKAHALYGRAGRVLSKYAQGQIA